VITRVVAILLGAFLIGALGASMIEERRLERQQVFGGLILWK
jgi:hypothetical protein